MENNELTEASLTKIMSEFIDDGGMGGVKDFMDDGMCSVDSMITWIDKILAETQELKKQQTATSG